jgi:adhesin/invasin
VVNKPACLPIQFQFQTASLANGSYSGEITVSDPNALDAPQIVTVIVKMGGGIPNSLNLYVAPNGSSASASMSSSNFIPSISTTTTDGRQWLSLAASGSGSFSFGVTYTVTATDLNGMAESAYQGSIGFSGSSFGPDNKTVQVNLQVTSQPIAGLPPEIPFYHVVQNSPKQTMAVAVTNQGLGSLTVSGTSASGGTWLSVGNTGTTINVTADPTGLAPGVYTGAITVASNAVNSPLSVPVQLSVVAPSAPFAYYGGAVNIATYRATDSVAQGDIVSVWGEQLCDQVYTASAVPLSTQLGTTSVLVNGVAAPLYFASSGQINIQVPFETQPGLAVVQVQRDGQIGNGVSMQVASRAAHILPLPATQYGIVQDYSQGYAFAMPPTSSYPSQRAHAGDVLIIWSTGLGQSNPPVATGAGAPGVEPLARIPAGTVLVHLGDRFSNSGVDLVPDYAGMTPTLVGLYQVNITIPSNAPKGDDVALYLELGNAMSNQVLVAIE